MSSSQGFWSASDESNYASSSSGEEDPQIPHTDDDDGDSAGDAETLQYHIQGEEDDNDDDDDDSSSEVDPEILNDVSDDEDLAPRSKRRAQCIRCQEITHRWQRDVERLTQDHERTKTTLRSVRIRLIRDHERTKTTLRNALTENGRLNEMVQELINGNRIVWEPWRPRLNAFLARLRGNDPNGERIQLQGYGKIYIDSCKQGIMAVDTRVVHPDLQIDTEVYTPAQIRNHFSSQLVQDRYHGLNYPRENCHFRFESLPIDVQYRIWKLLVPHNELIHCLSRLDPANPPLDCEPGNASYLHRFHIGDQICCIAKADKPSRFLEYLLVSKRWYYVIAHLFYATNTFAFSSLGEFGRFCIGIGRARVERLVHVELLWRGAPTPRQKKGVSIRKQALRWFMYTSRLRTLAIHINESGMWYMRRKYEMMERSDYYKDFADEDEFAEEDLNIFGMEVRRTDMQPNYRKTRAMRTIQGMDFIYQLRGLKWVRFYDTNAPCARTEIHDWSFYQDINRVVTRNKSDGMALRAELENLRPLTSLHEFVLDDETKELVERFYDDTPIRDVSIANSETSSSTSFSSASSTSYLTSSSDSSDSESDDDTGGSSRRPKPDGDSDGGRNCVAPNSPIVIDDDDGGDVNDSSSGLFVPSGSGTAPSSTTARDSDQKSTGNRSSASDMGIIDLTLDDESEEERKGDDIKGIESKEFYGYDDSDGVNRKYLASTNSCSISPKRSRSENSD